MMSQLLSQGLTETLGLTSKLFVTSTLKVFYTFNIFSVLSWPQSHGKLTNHCSTYFHLGQESIK